MGWDGMIRFAGFGKAIGGDVVVYSDSGRKKVVGGWCWCLNDIFN